MSGVTRNLAFIFAGTIVPLAVGLLVVGPSPPHGRTTQSATRVGHKALFRLVEALGYQPRRFERGLETPPPTPSVLMAVEPGAFLFREGGRYASGLRRWLEAGNGALVTLGPDPDHGADADDAGALFSDTTQRALDLARAVERSAQDETRDRASAQRETTAAPPAPADLEPGSPWSARALSSFLGVELRPDRLASMRADTPCPLTGPLAASLGQAPVIVATRPRTWSAPPASLRPLLFACGAPVLLELEVGAGRLLLLSEPRLIQNGRIGHGAHALLVVRALERLSAHAGSSVVYFEEFSHGGREASNPFALAFTTRARWPVLQLLLVIGVAVAAVAGRRRSVMPLVRPSRRRRAEAIDAMATLHLRSRDIRGAGARLVALNRRRLCRLVYADSASAGDPAQLAQLLGRRLEREAPSIQALLDATGIDDARALVTRAQALQALRVSAESQR